jgi:hypothetical protein
MIKFFVFLVVGFALLAPTAQAQPFAASAVGAVGVGSNVGFEQVAAEKKKVTKKKVTKKASPAKKAT